MTKTLVKDAYTEETHIYNDSNYGFQDKYDSGTVLACSLLPIYPTCKRLGLKKEHVSPFLNVFLDIALDYTLEELRNYNSMTDFVNKTGYFKSDDLYEDYSPGYITDLENTAFLYLPFVSNRRIFQVRTCKRNLVSYILYDI